MNSYSRIFKRRYCLVIGLVVIGLVVLTGCNGDTEVTPVPGATAVPVGSTSPVELPATNDIGTAEPNQPTVIGTPGVPVGQDEDDFLAIDEILGEIDNDVCQSAYETQLELEALIAEGVDVGELETAVEELIAELENCPTPTPKP